MKLADLAICVFVCSARCFAQFESLEEKENAKDKLDNFFVQADELSESYAVAFRQQTVLIHEPTGSIHSGSAGGITIESSKYKLRYYCYEFDSIGQNPPLPHRSESFLVGGLERRRSSVPLSGFDSLRKPRTVLPDPVSGMRAAVDSSSFGLLAQEIDPFGLVLNQANA